MFGRARNRPELLANAVLGFMINCMFGGPSFLAKMLPVAKLDASFLKNQMDLTVACVEKSGGSVIAFVCDDNRTNQKYFKSFPTVPDKPWVTVDNKYLLFDYVHLIKSIRNNWLTEKSGELLFEHDGVIRTAKWSHLVQLYNFETSGEFVKMSKLTEKAIRPKSTEKQSVSICLQVFCEETLTSLLTHPILKHDPEVSETALFIQNVIRFWKIVNVHSKGFDTRKNDPDRAVFSSSNDPRLDFLQGFGTMCLNMISTPRKREKQLTRDTALAVYQTCSGLVDLTRYLLSKPEYEYVALGKFTSDKLEKAFGKLRQGSGGAYFITVQQILEKLNIKKAWQLLKHSNIDQIGTDVSHACSQCDYTLDEGGVAAFDHLEELEDGIKEETKISLVHIAGYVTRRDQGQLRVLSENDDDDGTTFFYFERYGEYTREMDRGGLHKPTDSTCQWVFFCYIMFVAIKESVCRLSLSRVFDEVSDTYHFSMRRNHSRTLSNIFLNNYCREMTPRSNKEANQKVLKLSFKD